MKSYISKYKTYIFALVLLFFILLGFWIYKIVHYTYITVDFPEFRPVHEHIYVYYKGLKIGRVKKMRHSNDYKSTIVRLVLYPAHLMLPENTTALLKKEKKKRKEFDFIELVYPEEPSDRLIADGSTIHGKITVDIETYMANRDPDELDQIKDNINHLFENGQALLSVLIDLVGVAQETIEENRPNLLRVTKNLSQITTNLNQTTSKLNRAMSQQRLDNTVGNVSVSSENVEATTRNLQVITQSLDETAKSINGTMPQINSTLSDVRCITKNLNEITCGISQTLKKKFGGMRLFFGKTIGCECDKRCRD